MITSKGKNELCVAKQIERKAPRLLKATLTAIESNFGRAFMIQHILPRASSLVTDSLWKRDDEVAQLEHNILYLKIWCAAHRPAPVFAELEAEQPVVSKVLAVLASISSYYHTSSVRTNELNQIALQNKLANVEKPHICIRSAMAKIHFPFGQSYPGFLEGNHSPFEGSCRRYQ